ncbi:septum formation protein Maf [Endozoicomonas sp. OPT23]|nr:Maf family protein [Endozoicomonas sp. OPT23]MRI32262.1 septum formation protein Maf [Endozoicomonas sp. OPT23]
MIYLASQSPRRRELLDQIGVPYTVLSCEIDETPTDGEEPQSYVERMAREKAKAGWLCVACDGLTEHPVLAADTSVILGKKILGKPENSDHACDMLLALSGTCHEVITAVAVYSDRNVEVTVSRTKVRMTTFSKDVAKEYIATGEPADKAGAYGIQGYGAVLVDSIEGSYSGVVGLPLKETAELLKTFGVTPWHASGS